jgi:5-methylcytosine-specific restriction endonuclease McrA
MSKYSLTHLSDGTLLRDLTTLVARDRTNTAELLAHLAEVDARRLYLPAGYSSMHAYCEQDLRLSEDAANKRIRVARKAREIPALFAAIADGRLNLNGVVLLSSHLTRQNAEEMVAAASGKSRFAIERLIAERSPRSETLSMIPGPASAVEEGVVVTEVPEEPLEESTVQLAARPVEPRRRPTRVAPIARGRFDLHVSVGEETLDKLHRAQALLSHTIPNGDLPAVLDRVLDLAIQQLEKKKFGGTSKHRPPQSPSRNPRHVPAHVRHVVWDRDGGQCTFVSENEHRCTERKLLEFDHIVPLARGGGATVENLRLRCRAHNQFEAERAFGSEFMRRKRERAAGRGGQGARKTDQRTGS